MFLPASDISLDEALRVGNDPGMVHCQMIGDKIEHQLKTDFVEFNF